MTWLSQPAAVPPHQHSSPACAPLRLPASKPAPFSSTPAPSPATFHSCPPPPTHTHHPLIPHLPPFHTWVLGSGGLDHGGDAREAAEATPGSILRGGAVRTACILRLDAVVHVVLRVRGGMDCGGGKTEGGVGSREGRVPACPPG